MLSRTARLRRVRDVDSIPLGAIPDVLEAGARALSNFERRLVENMDGLHTVGEIARISKVPVGDLRALLLELAWQRQVRFYEFVEVDESDTPEDVPVDEPDPEVLLLVRRRDDDLISGMIRDVLAALAEQTDLR